MPWQETQPMYERTKFIAAVEAGEFSMAELCRRYGISRKTGYKWLRRFESEGLAGLAARSRQPHHSPWALDASTQRTIVQLKYRYPHWGPKKLKQRLMALYSRQSWPAVSTIGELLKRQGLVKPRRRQARVVPMSEPLSHCQSVNAVWSADFKGQFRLADQQWCYPLTVSDNYSRYLLDCYALGQPRAVPVQRRLERLFRCYGLPQAIRTDNGSPFASRALGGLSRLSVWWLKLGIWPERIAPGQPQQNGRHERLHRTLKAEATQPASKSRRGQQQRFRRFQQVYNETRPHEALAGRTPGQVYRPSLRRYPERVPVVDYDEGIVVRQVRNNGLIKWRGELYFVSEALIGEPVGLTTMDDDRWQLQFAGMPLGILDTRLGRVVRPA